jgi:hypothetical protein
LPFCFPQCFSAFRKGFPVFLNGFTIFLNGFPLSKKSKKIYLRWQVSKRLLFELRISRRLLSKLRSSRYYVYISPNNNKGKKACTMRAIMSAHQGQQCQHDKDNNTSATAQTCQLNRGKNASATT